MTPQFSETAPGVHTATLTNRKTQRLHNIAIIESCDAWQLFVDGELKSRDLPSFKAAVAAAQSQVTAGGASTMVRVACALVLVGVAGASTIGFTSILQPLLGTETVAAQISRDTKPKKSTTRGKAASKPAVVKKIAAKISKRPPVETVTTAVGAAVEPVKAPALPAQPVKPDAQPSLVASSVEAETPQSDVRPIGLRPITLSAVAATKQRVAPTRNEVAETEPTPVVAEPKPEIASPATTPEVDRKADNAESLAPPPPARAPAVAAPVIRSARAPIATEPLFADNDEEADQDETPDRYSQSASAPRATERRASKRNTAAKRAHRAKRTAPRRARNVHRKSFRSARHQRSSRARRMSCFGHTCRFR